MLKCTDFLANKPTSNSDLPLLLPSSSNQWNIKEKLLLLPGCSCVKDDSCQARLFLLFLCNYKFVELDLTLLKCHHMFDLVLQYSV